MTQTNQNKDYKLKNDTQVVKGLVQLPNAPTTLPDGTFKVVIHE
jgi:hypothetical protein